MADSGGERHGIVTSRLPSTMSSSVIPSEASVEGDHGASPSRTTDAVTSDHPAPPPSNRTLPVLASGLGPTTSTDDRDRTLHSSSSSSSSSAAAVTTTITRPLMPTFSGPVHAKRTTHEHPVGIDGIPPTESHEGHVVSDQTGPNSAAPRSARGGRKGPTTSKKRIASASKATFARATRAPTGGSRPTSILSDHPLPPPSEHHPNGDEPSDVELFCVCRKPDNHSWMIACDGGCNDWFHGACVDMTEDEGRLIDAYICPECETINKRTTWKRICRLQDCRRPARANPKGGTPSKYCCDEHGREFMASHLPSSSSDLPASACGDHTKPTTTTTRRTGLAPTIGGSLNVGQVAAVARVASTASDFRRLGQSVWGTMGVADAPNEAEPSVDYTDAEQRRLTEIHTSREALTDRIRNLERWEQMILRVRQRARRDLPQGSCGYDHRLDRASQDETVARALVDNNSGCSEMDEASKPPTCRRQRCDRHRNWVQTELQHSAFERARCTSIFDVLAVEERDIHGQAKVRRAATVVGGLSEGTVEVISGNGSA